MGALAAAVIPSFTSHAADLIAGWDFEKVESDGVSIKSVVGPFVGTIENAAILTDAGGGRPGAGGGKGFDVSVNNAGWLYLEASGDDNPMNRAAVDDQTTVVLWQKNNNNINSSSFWCIGDGYDRAYQFHVPWSDGTIYFDTSGGCCGANQRQSMNVVSVFPDHDWTAWNHYAFVKDGGTKRIYVNGELLVEGEGYDPLPLTFTALTIGGQNRSSPPDAVIDDFAIYKGILTVEEIKALAAGGSPFTPPVDTDGDGMPDDWETQFGFNPNNPADATQDADNDGATNLAEYQAGTNPTDTTKPTVTSAAGTATLDTVILTFSENLDPVSAQDKSHYTITPALEVTGATLKKNVVTLTTAAQTPGATAYTVKVNNVLDTSKNAVLPDSSAIFYSYLMTKTGVLKFSFWGGISGNPVENLTLDPRYPASPDWTGAVFSGNSRDILPTDANEAYGATMEGWVTPTESGNYDFFLRSDDASELWISSDATEANATLQAYETGCCDPFKEPGAEETTTAPLALTAGNKYFIRVIYKEGGGGDYGQVAWRKATDTATKPAISLAPIPGKYLSAAVDLPAPPQGAFLTQTPAANAKNVSPATAVTIVHRDGKTAWTSDNVTLKFDDNPVVPVFTKDGNVLTIKYQPPALLTGASTHKVTLGYLDAGGQPASTEWSFAVAPFGGVTTKDKVGGYPGLLMGSSVFTADAGGHTGQAGDKAIDLTLKGGPVVSSDPTFIAQVNAAIAADELTVAFWQKKLDTADSSAFTVNSPSAGNGRAFHAHVPWSNQNVYFDTVGCCDGTTQRITADINTFPDYTTGDPRDNLWWTTQYHFFVFSKKGSFKQIWIDGKPFLSGDSTYRMPADVDAFYMGSGGYGAELSHAIIDDFSIYGKEMTQANVEALFAGTLPTALPAAAGLIAYWDYNDSLITVPTISINGTTITYTGTLTSSTTLNGTFNPVAGAASPYQIPAGTQGSVYYRSSQ
ncbi:MAG TPA: hypothetical protein DCE44_00765 [Verrucomicrobiales bacterium]|nr:hypothetical protein [Verrucomicrobiales bacterium]